MELKINKEKCLICGMCASSNPEVFTFNDDGFIEVDNNKINEENKDEIINIKECCPVGAIEEKDEEK